MRPKILIFCGLVLAVCVWFLLRRAPEPPKTEAPEVQAPLTNQPLASQPAPPAKVAPAQNPAPSQPPPAVAAAVQRGSPEGLNEIQQRILADWQRPIEFYGKVVDENTNPVAGAKISFQWVETPKEEGTRHSDAQSDAEGLFSLHDAHGPSLIVWVSKEGYYASHKGQWGFSYTHGDFHPDGGSPVIFLLHKKGAGENLIGVKQNYRVARDGTPLGIDLATGKATTGGSGDFVVQCWTDDQGKASGQKYDWHCVVTIPGGGVVPTDEEFAFQAPEKGYAPTNGIAMPADRTDWTSDVDLKFYYRLADGRYGRMTFSMIAGGQHFCMIDSVLNPSGSRNLEPQ